MQLEPKFFIRKSGQRVGYLELGNSSLPPLLFFHGFPGSSRQILIANKDSIAQHFRLIAIDRPGFGDSSFVENRKLQDIVPLTTELLAFLGVDRFHLMSVSGGNPSVFVLGDQLRNRVLSITDICGLGPLAVPEVRQSLSNLSRFLFRSVQLSPRVLIPALELIHRRIQSEAELHPKALRHFLPRQDIEIVMNPRVRAIFRESMGHAMKQGTRFVAYEILTFLEDWQISDWKFSFPVHIWHGTEDRIVPVFHSEYLARTVLGSHLHLLRGDGHYSLPVLRIEEILKPLL